MKQSALNRAATSHLIKGSAFALLLVTSGFFGSVQAQEIDHGLPQVQMLKDGELGKIQGQGIEQQILSPLSAKIILWDEGDQGPDKPKDNSGMTIHVSLGKTL